MSKVEDVHRLIKKYFWEMPDDASLSTGKNCVLAEEAFDFFEEYAELFNVDMKQFIFVSISRLQESLFCRTLFCQNICAPIIINLSL